MSTPTHTTDENPDARPPLGEEKPSRTGKVKSAFKRFIRNLFLIILIVGVGALIFLHVGTYSTGQRAGSILEINKRGALFKTYEGRMKVMNPRMGNGLPEDTHFNFSVRKSDTLLIRQLENASIQGENVQLRFEEKYVAFPWRGETKFFATEVKPLDMDEGR